MRLGERDVVSDEVWAVIGPLLPGRKGNGRSVAERRLVVGAWRGSSAPGAVAGCPRAVRELEYGVQELRPLGEGRHLGEGPGARPGPRERSRGTGLGRLDRLHDRPRPPARREPCPHHGAHANYMKLGRSRVTSRSGATGGGLTTKLHLVSDGKGWKLGGVLTAGNVNDTTIMAARLEQI